uniref:SusC/RagA family TonB-linked outer membrane protein n=1 Tax=Roseihalotalea indica TaxID=2867963 RepID=A0AA49GKS1_9BACT|nr:SusC/RagA family TonB-linked outer membrane protein [Tunicatimonas sp. TK19036]
MKHLYLPKHSIWLILLLALSLPVHLQAQDFSLTSMTADASLTQGTLSKKVSLKKALAQLADQYQISINYSEQEIEQHKVAPELIHNEYKNPEDALKSVLAVSGLKYKKIGKIDYVIRPVKIPAKKKPVKPQDFMVDLSGKQLVLPTIRELRVTVQGTVTGEEGEGLPGVNVVEKGTTNGTVSDVEGNYTLSVESNSSVLVFSSIGFITQEIGVGGQTTIDVEMMTDTKSLNEVVVTALGIEREERSLGYDVANVDGEQLRQVSQESVLSSLSGRVPGVTINQTSGPGSSMSVIIRGATSLTTDNQPLFVVDGVPMSNGLNNVVQNGDGNQVDYGNAISDINPDDIESINVLKGPSAAALYGTRAGNGVIIITTKSGTRNKPMGVSFSTSNVFERATRLLDFHYKYANGQRNGVFNEGSAYWGGPNLDEGITAVQWNSPVDENGVATPTELRSYPDAMRDFMQTGITSNNNLAISGGNEKGSFRVSYSNMMHNGMIPNSDLYRNNLSTAIDYTILDKLTFSSNINVGRTHSNDRPSTGDRRANPLEAVYASPYIDYNEMKGIWEEGQEDIQQIRTDAGDNPYFIAYGIENAFVRDRIYGNLSLTYDFTDKFSLMARYSLDRVNENRETKIPFSYSRAARGGYFLSDISSQESNTDFLASYNTEAGLFDVNLSFGGNLMHREFFSSSVGSGNNRNNGLVIPGVFNVGNIPLDNISVGSSIGEKAIYSLYALASFGFKDQLYLDVTGRNDWSSTLPESNRSYFYPSASLSWLANYTFDLPETVNMLKLRAGWAQVGNDTESYRLEPSLSTGNYNSVTTVSVPAGLLNPNLLPEQSTSMEGGIDLNMFENKLRFSGTYYTIDNENQIFAINLPQSSGFSSKFINAGLIRSKGWELTLGGTPIQRDGLSWDIDVNWSTNTTTVEELSDNLEFITLWGENGGGAITDVGEEIGNMYSAGYAYVQDESSPYYRWPVLSENGEWIELSGRENMRYVGNFNPDFIMGLQTALRFKRFTLSASFDWRQGGEFMSFTYRYGESDWKSQRQLDNLIPGGLYNADELIDLLKSDPEKYIIPEAGNYPRVGGHTTETGGFPVDDEGNDGAFVPGVIQTAGADTPDDFSDDEYTEHLGGPGTNIYPITNTYPWDYNEQVTFDASFIKLRELSLAYQIPSFGFISNASFAIYTRNIMLWTAADIGIDPERAFQANNSAQGDTQSQFRQGIERQNVMPWSVPVGFKLNFNF